MTFADDAEHYVTLFDSGFMLPGLALYESLRSQCQPFHLWVLTTDELAFEQLTRLSLPEVSLMPLKELETPELAAVRPGRTRGEYAWTLTPFVPTFVFDRCSVRRVTYVDADLYFFDSPAPFFEELERSGKEVLITPHGYAPEYDATARSGKFCVQYLTFTNTPGAHRVLRWWQERCIEWCFDRYEPHRFGDQKYLDDWPERFAREVHVLSQSDRTVAPWNVDFVARSGALRPVFYHFQGLRLLSRGRLKLFHNYRVGAAARPLYEAYVAALARAARKLLNLGYPLPVMPEHRRPFMALRKAILYALGRTRYVDFNAWLSVAETTGAD